MQKSMLILKQLSISALVAVFISGCATMTEAPKQNAARSPLYDGASPVTFESVFSAGDGADYVALGDRELAKGEIDKALFAYLQALESANDKTDLYFKVGGIHLGRGNLDLAEKAFNLALESNADDTATLQALGLIHLKARNYARAEEYFKLAIKADEKRFIGLEEHEAVPVVSNEEVIRIKRNIATLKQDLREALKHRSDLYGQMNSLTKDESHPSSYDSKIAGLNKRLERLSRDFTDNHPDVLLIKSQLTQLEAKRDQEQSLIHSGAEREQGLAIRERLAQSNDKATQIGSQLRAKQQELLNAEAVIMQRKAVKPYDSFSPVWAYNGLGILADLNGRYDEAIEYYQKANQIKPRSAQINNNLGYSNYLSDNWADAEKYYRNALNYDRNYERTWRNLGLLYTRMGQYEDALITFNRVMEKAAAYNSIGYLCMLQGKHIEADQFFDKAIELMPSYYTLAYENKDKNKLLQTRNIAKRVRENGEEVTQ